MNILARWKYDGKSSGTATTIGKQSSSRRRYIRYGTTNTIRRLPRLKRAVRTRATRTKRRGHPTRTRRTVPSPKIKVMDEQHQKTLSPIVDSNRFYRQRIVRQFRLPRDPNRSHSETPCKRIYLSLHMANIFSFCSANIFNHPNAARFPVHQIRPVIQDNIGRATPSQESTTLAPVPEDAGPVAHQDDLPAATTLAPAPENAGPVAPQDDLPAEITLAPAHENAGLAASTSALTRRRFPRTVKMRPGFGCTARYVR